MKNRFHLFFLIVLIFLSALVRFYHYDFGIPRWNLYDEKRATRQTINFYNGKYLVHTLNHPPLIKYCALVMLKSYNWIKPIKKHNLRSLTNKSLRLVSIIAGTLAVLFLYLLARQFLDPVMSLIAAAIYAFLPITVFISKHGIPDTLLSLMFILNFYLIIKLYRKKTLWLYLFNGLFLALGVASKYNAVFLYGSFFTAHFFAAKQEKNFLKFFFDWKQATLFLSGTILGLSIGFPTVLGGLEFNNLIGSLLFEKKHLFGTTLDVTHHGFKYFYMFHFIKSVFPVTGPILLLFILTGIAYIIKRHEKTDIILLISFLPYYFIIEYVFKIHVGPDRYVLPIVSLYILFAVVFCDKLIKYLNLKLKIHKSILIVFFSILLGFYPVIKTTKLLVTIIPDTRDQMADWINKNIEPNSLFFYPLKKFDYYPVLSSDRYPFKSLKRSNTHYSHIKTSNIDYVLISDFGYKNVPKTKRFYKELKNKAELIYVMKPKYQSYLLHNPTLELYKIPKK